MTEREKRNEEWKSQIRRDAAAHCHFIDLMELEMKKLEAINQSLADEIDRRDKQEQKDAA